MKSILSLFALLLLSVYGYSQDCAPDEVTVGVTILTDGYGYETSFDLVGADGTVYGSVAPNTLADFELYEYTYCIPSTACLTLVMQDEYGDGIFIPGYYRLTLNDVQVFQGGVFASEEAISFNCGPGFNCNSAIEVAEGDHTANPMQWFKFTPVQTGEYLITTCGTNTCDTKIWVYSNCSTAYYDTTNAGTLAYDDNYGNCGLQANLNIGLGVGITYYIRIGDANGSCAGELINWSITYSGEASGCTDPNACNFNPLATIDDGSCISQGDPDCPDGPDLTILQQTLINSLEVDYINSSDGCLVSEGCLNGFGQREVIRFTTHIKNIGEFDYIIGSPTPSSNQFTFDNCHNHWHYEGYAEYLLFDAQGNNLPSGFKNGFCVLDLECSDGGDAQYTCGYMGITAGCGDIYGSYLDCQWLDVTDVPEGVYTMVVRVNWDNSPDMLGHIEKDTLNNWAQVCLNLTRPNGPGSLQFTVNTDCPPLVDCNGTPFGNAQIDCNGVCGGSALKGDLDNNSIADMTDAQLYVSMMLGNDITPSTCNDLSGDGEITVYDADLLASCINIGTNHIHPGQGVHNHCNFPNGIYNFMDTVGLSIVDFNMNDKYVDVAIENPDNRVKAYQFQMSGLAIQWAENLVDASNYPILPSIGLSDGTVVGISYQDSTIMKNPIAHPLVRIHYTELTGGDICISNIVSVVNQDDHEVFTKIDGGCIDIVGTDNLAGQFGITVQPNPFLQNTRLTFHNPDGQAFQLNLTDITGKIVRQYKSITGSEFFLERNGLPAGIYIGELTSGNISYSCKLIVQ